MELCRCGATKDKRASVCRACYAATPTEKRCGGCQKVRPASDFSLRRNGTALRARCKECEANYSRKARKDDPVKVYARKRRWETSDTPGARRYRIRMRCRGLKLDPKPVLEYFDAHAGACDICGEKPSGSLHIDHDHDTGAFRGLLCSRCNTGIGQMRDNPELLIQAAEYIKSRRE